MGSIQNFYNVYYIYQSKLDGTFNKLLNQIEKTHLRYLMTSG